MLKTNILRSLYFLTCVAFIGSASANMVSLEGMGIIEQWTDFDNQTGEMPGHIWGTSDTTSEDRIGIHVEFASGLVGSATYSGVSGLWNTSNFTPIAADTATGFFTSAQGLHFLFNTDPTLIFPQALPMAWAGFVMPLTGNFDLDYHNINNSHFRADVGDWGSAVFTTYSSAVAPPGVIPIPAALPLFFSALGVMGFVGWRKRRA